MSLNHGLQARLHMTMSMLVSMPMPRSMLQPMYILTFRMMAILLLLVL